MKNGLTIEVETKLTVSNESAERCLRILEMWQEDNPGKFIEGRKVETETGRKTLYRIVNRGEDGNSKKEKQKTESNSGVVYCKDCKFGVFNGNQRVCIRLIGLDEDTFIIDKNGYCSHGERKYE